MAVISIRGGAKPAARKTKPATKRAAAKPAAKAAPRAKARMSVKSSNGRKAPERVNRSSKMPDIPKSELNRILKPLKRSADNREKHYADWKSEVAAVNEYIVEALNAEIPVKEIVENAQVSRQHVYKIIADMDAGKRSDDGVTKGVPGRPAAKKTPRRSAGAKKITRTNGRKASTAAPARSRIRVRG